MGSDVVAYGGMRTDGRSWGAWAREDLALDPKRTHWMGALQSEEYHDVLACSDVHLYLTVPFVLSWSLLEAMAAGCALVCSATPPVEEVLGTAQLFWSIFSLLKRKQQPSLVCSIPDLRLSLAAEAQQRASQYQCEKGQEAWMQLLSHTVIDRTLMLALPFLWGIVRCYVLFECVAHATPWWVRL